MLNENLFSYTAQWSCALFFWAPGTSIFECYLFTKTTSDLGQPETSDSKLKHKNFSGLKFSRDFDLAGIIFQEPFIAKDEVKR